MCTEIIAKKEKEQSEQAKMGMCTKSLRQREWVYNVFTTADNLLIRSYNVVMLENCAFWSRS